VWRHVNLSSENLFLKVYSSANQLPLWRNRIAKTAPGLSMMVSIAAAMKISGDEIISQPTLWPARHSLPSASI
jgi:hypothetical protein